MFKQGFKETIEGRVTLQGDWEGAVEAVMHYFYNFTYDLQQLTSAMTYNGEQLSKLKAHVLVWVAADKYEIPGLKLRTRRKMQMEMMGVSAGWYEPEPDNTSNALTTNPFMQQVPRFILSQSRVTDLFSVIDFAYNHPKQGADGLRQLFVHIWHSLPRDVRENLPQDAVRDLFQQQPDFAIDIAVTPREDYSSKELIKRIW
ncbi:hypothetical protein HII31_03701 [Pseudocercospora fuligena]|uniref:BTB domain-containing protein n=1 Tax=Pseudocercospora fuligena TaxID=685502 RepID=A0A8H6VLT6_9PEZI|nr:hypothetical protein HII31_03701 [Pseudocercospora fuligena]